MKKYIWSWLGALFSWTFRTPHTHTSNFPFESFYIFFCFSPPASFFPASVENGLKRDGEKRDAIKMKLVPKRRPKAKFYVRQPCRMCIYSLTGLFRSLSVGALMLGIFDIIFMNANVPEKHSNWVVRSADSFLHENRTKFVVTNSLSFYHLPRKHLPTLSQLSFPPKNNCLETLSTPRKIFLVASQKNCFAIHDLTLNALFS
jgi:hypothetical protein